MAKQQFEIKAIIRDKRGMVLSIGQNSYVKTHTYQARMATRAGKPHKIFLHAEIDAILKCNDISKAHSIEVIRLGASGEPLSAKPCPICQSAIDETSIKKIIHT